LAEPEQVQRNRGSSSHKRPLNSPVTRSTMRWRGRFRHRPAAGRVSAGCMRGGRASRRQESASPPRGGPGQRVRRRFPAESDWTGASPASVAVAVREARPGWDDMPCASHPALLTLASGRFRGACHAKLVAGSTIGGADRNPRIAGCEPAWTPWSHWVAGRHRLALLPGAACQLRGPGRRPNWASDDVNQQADTGPANVRRLKPWAGSTRRPSTPAV
jgi:hypothetical protein